MKKTIFIILGTLFLIGFYFFVVNIKERSKQNTFINNSLGYEIEYKSPWRISNSLSKEFAKVNYVMNIISEMECEDSINDFSEDEVSVEDQQKKADECLKSHPEYNEYMQKIGSFLNNWSAEKSSNILLTDWSIEEENAFISQLSRGEKTIVDISHENNSNRSIGIYSSYSDLSFAEEKNTSSEKNRRVIFERKIINLKNDIKAYYTNFNGDLLVFVPHPIKDNSDIGETEGLLFSTSNKEFLSEVLNTLELK
jgi:hypothetical protein